VLASSRLRRRRALAPKSCEGNCSVGLCIIVDTRIIAAAAAAAALRVLLLLFERGASYGACGCGCRRRGPLRDELPARALILARALMPAAVVACARTALHSSPVASTRACSCASPSI